MSRNCCKSEPSIVEFDALETDASGDGSQELFLRGELASIDIIPDESASFDISIDRVLPDGTLANIYAEVGVTTVTTVSPSQMTPNPTVLNGIVRVTLSNAGQHANPANVYFTVV